MRSARRSIGYGPSRAAGWTNEGTITATGGATLALLGRLEQLRHDQRGCRTPRVLLGNVTSGQLADDPYAVYNAWSSSGSMTIADGATVYLGGFLTTDQYLGACRHPRRERGILPRTCCSWTAPWTTARRTIP